MGNFDLTKGRECFASCRAYLSSSGKSVKVFVMLRIATCWVWNWAVSRNHGIVYLNSFHSGGFALQPERQKKPSFECNWRQLRIKDWLFWRIFIVPLSLSKKAAQRQPFMMLGFQMLLKTYPPPCVPTLSPKEWITPNCILKCIKSFCW